MMNKRFPITASQIRTNCSSSSYQRGSELFDNGDVSELISDGLRTSAAVEGSRGDQYDVELLFGSKGLADARCSCEYSGDGWCKHIVATLLECLHTEDGAEPEFDLSSAISECDRDDLQLILMQLVNDNPELIQQLRIALSRKFARSATGIESAQSHLISASAVRKSIVTTMSHAVITGNSNFQWDDNGSEVSMEIHNVVSPILSVVNESAIAGNLGYAFGILEVVTQELIKGWIQIQDYIYEDPDLFADIGDAWARALLSPQCTDAERNKWVLKLEEWRNDTTDCGAEYGLAHASLAAKQGWTNADLICKLGGNEPDLDAAENDDDDDDESIPHLSEIRVSMLVEQQRMEEAINLAFADRLHSTYLDLLVTTGQTASAAEYARANLTDPGAVMCLAKRLHESNQTELALEIAWHGLSLSGYTYTLATWTRDVAFAAGQMDLAMQAGIAAIDYNPELEDYEELKSISAEGWPEIRDRIIASILTSNNFDDGKADILMHEGYLLEALSRVRDYDYTLMEKVVIACLPQYPAQVIPQCRIQAERVIESKKADRYHHAIRWLKLCKSAYQRADNLADWNAYKEELMRVHSRKSSLMPSLRGL